MGGQKYKILFLQNTKSATSKCGLKVLLPSIVDLFDRCFPHKTGEGLQLWFFCLIGYFLRWEPLKNSYVSCYFKKFPAGLSFPHAPSPQPPYKIENGSVDSVFLFPIAFLSSNLCLIVLKSPIPSPLSITSCIATSAMPRKLNPCYTWNDGYSLYRCAAANRGTTKQKMLIDLLEL